MIGDSFPPPLGQPSLTRDEIITLYNRYGLSYSESDIASDLENANKYSATGIEGQIAKRASNVAGSGVAVVPVITVLNSTPPLTNVPDSHVGNVLATGAPIAPGTYAASGPTGLAPGYYGGPVYPGGTPAGTNAAASIFGFSPLTLIVLVAMAGAAFYFLRK